MNHETTVRLARLTAAVVLGRWDELRALRRAAPAGEPDRRWREALLQVHLFAGFPRVIEAWSVLDEEGGLGPADPEESRWHPDRPARGRALFARVYGTRAGDLRRRLAGHHPLLAAWIEGHAYGRVLTRGGLDFAERELLACAALAALGQERQLAAHARGALGAGVDAAGLRATVEAALAWADDATAAAARHTLRSLT